MERLASLLAAALLASMTAPASAVTPAARPASNVTPATLAHGLLDARDDVVLLDAVNGTDSLSVGDLDADGIGEVLMLSHEQSPPALGWVDAHRTFGVVYPDRQGPIRLRSRLRTRQPTGMPLLTSVLAGIRIAEHRCFVVATNGATVGRLQVDCGLNGPSWSMDDSARATITSDGNVAAARLWVPLDVADLDQDGVSEILVGRYSGTTAAGWAATFEILDAATGVVEWSWTTLSAGVAPTATFHERLLGPLVSIASATPDPRTGVSAMITTFDPRSPFAIPTPLTVWQTGLPRPSHPVALAMQPLSGTGWPEGGLAVSVVADDRASSGLRAGIIGPSATVGLGRGGLERFRIELPSAASFELLDLDGDASIDARTVRIDLDSLVVETWSGAGTNAKTGEHRMSFLEADDYDKAAHVRLERDLDGDGVGELGIAGGFPCGPRIQVLSRLDVLWEIPESRSLFCDRGLTAAGPVILSGTEDRLEGLIEWRTLWSCCLGGASPVHAQFRLRDGTDGLLQWSTDVPEWQRVTGARGHVVGDVTGDGVPDPVLVVERSPAGVAVFDGASGNVVELDEY